MVAGEDRVVERDLVVRRVNSAARQRCVGGDGAIDQADRAVVVVNAAAASIAGCVAIDRGIGAVNDGPVSKDAAATGIERAGNVVRKRGGREGNGIVLSVDSAA